VSGGILVDSTDRVDLVNLNTVSGDATVRLDEGHPANSCCARQRPAHGRRRQALEVGPSNYVDSVGELSGSFADVRALVSGDVTVLRRRRRLRMPRHPRPQRRTEHASRLLARRPAPLLNLLDESPRHGYDLMQALSDRTGGTYTPSAGTIYPRLSKLEEEGLVTKTVDGRKTVYAITEAGRAEVAARAHELEGIEADSPTACA
jgi:DNA-binding HxlR family transcriptional regulator